MSSLKGNIILNFINTLAGILFPIITFPYAARVLLPDGIGTINFLQSIVSYIVLLTSLGIPMYAVREIARHRDDIKERNKATVEIILLSLFLCLAGYICVLVIGELVPQINSDLSIFYVLSLTILFTALGVNWFYQAVEDFKFITIRGLIFRVLAAAALFILVKDSGDLLMYSFVIVGSTVGNNIINFVHLRKYIHIGEIQWSRLEIWRHLKPALHIFVFNVITSIYLNLNTVMLGFMNGEASVGFYTTGYKLSQIILTVVGSMGAVLLPRCSNLVESGRSDEFREVTRKSYLIVCALSFPIIAGLIMISGQAVEIFFGADYSASVKVLAWTSPIILFISVSNVTGIQVLYPQGKENIVIWSVFIGAVINVLLNIFLLPRYAHVGAAMSTFVTEAAVLAIQVLLGRKYIPFSLFDRACLNYMAGAIILTLPVLAIIHLVEGVWMQVILSIMIGAVSYLIFLLVRKDALTLDVLKYTLQTFRLKN